MTHLLAGLLRAHNPALFALLVLEAILGFGIAMRLLVWRRCSAIRPLLRSALFSLVAAPVTWVSFMTALAGTYPKVSLAAPATSIVPAMMMSLLANFLAASIQQRGRRSARNAMFAGSLLAFGFSCTLFIGMAALVRPFELGYDLAAVLIVMVIGAALCGLALLECGNPDRRHPWLIATGLMTVAVCVLSFGSLAAILPFEAWMATVTQPDDLASSPIAILVAAEAVGVLALGLSGALVDNRLAAREKLETDRLRQLADSAFEGILIHCNGEILDGNESLGVLLGLPLAELRASPVSRFLIPCADTFAWTAEGGSAPIETEIVAADGSRRPVEILSRSISYHGKSALVTALRDVRERRISEERIRFLAHHDMLTELPNRVVLSEKLEHALALAARTGNPLAVLCLDLDGFKLVNDTLGHAAGDQLLCQVATRLREILRPPDFVARIGGDEFIVIQPSGTPPEQSAHLARRIAAGFVPGFQVDGHDVNVGVSIGIAVYPHDGDTADMLMKNADLALYHAKEHARGWFCTFGIGINQPMRQRREMEHDLRAALQNNEFTLNFQPIFNKRLEPAGFEALLRWTHPRLGLISPAQFIPLAEASGIIIPLGEWVMRSACMAAVEWEHPSRISVNLSPSQFLRGDLRMMIATILAETGLAPARLELEITEGVLMDNTESSLLLMKDLRTMGVRLALDDFGTGYSSLSYLQRFLFDTLKADRSFVQQLETSADTRAIVNAIIGMSCNLGIEVTAEGVETQAQLDLLLAQGCNAFQGFLLGRPLAQDAVAPFLRGHLAQRLDVA